MNKIKRRIYFLFLINLSLISFSKNAECDDMRCRRDGFQCKSKVGESCSSNCKPNIFSQACYDCGDQNYYQIDESSKACTGMDSCTGFIIYGSNQCVSSCGNYYKLGGFCYPSCSGNMEIKNELTRECKCNSFYYIGSNNEYHCLFQCEYFHVSYDISNKLCSTSDCSPGQKKKNVNGINRCSSECLPDEYVDDDETCVDRCPDTKKYYYKDEYGQKFCSNDCSEAGLYYKEGEEECVSINECDFIDGQLCKNLPNNCLHNYGDKICLEDCTGTHPFEDREDLICYEHCPTKYIQPNTNLCEKDISDCYYKADEDVTDRECYHDYCPSGTYQIYNTNKCVTTCPDDYKYTFLDDGKCYSSCASIPNIGQFYYVDSNNKCICYLYGTVSGEIKCFDSEAACFDNNLKYKKGNQCLDSCLDGDYIYIAQKDHQKWINECYSDYNDCKKYPYYNKELKECYLNLPQDNSYYPNEINPLTNLPKEDSNGNTYYKNKCGSQYNNLTVSKVCKEKCDDNEYYVTDTANNYNICKDKCDDSGKEFIDVTDKKCVPLSDCNFYIEESDGKKRCVPNCKSKGKFSFKKINPDDKKCYDSCVRDDKNNFYNSDNECLSSCTDNQYTDKKYAYPNDDGPKECVSKPEDKCYNDSLIIVGDSCKLYSKDDPQLCVYECAGYVSDFKCVSKCPDSESFYVYTEFELSSDVSINIYKCIPKCSDANDAQNTYNFFDIFTNQCLKECNSGNNHEYYDNKCYPVCSGGQKVVPDPNPEPAPGDWSCTNSCSSLQMKYEKITDSILICKSECEGTKKYIKESSSPSDDKECVEACDVTQVIKIDDHVCKSNCDSGEFKIKALSRPTGVNHDIYECVKLCPTENYYFYVKEDNGNYQNECLQECPTEYNKMVEGKYECVQNCPDEYPYYYESDKNSTGNYYKCTDHFKCDEGEFFCSGCKTIAQIKSQSKQYIENNKCVSRCTTGYKYYKYQKDSNFIYICKKECDPNEYVLGSECVTKCPSGANHIHLNNICKESCDTVGQGNLIYEYTYETDVIMCADKCPEKYPYSTDDNKCMDECPGGTYFSKQENHCYHDCSQSSVNKYKLDVRDNSNNIIERKCLYECNDPDHYEYKYLDNNECRKTCQHYVKEDSNQCTSSCGTGYYIYIDDNAPSGAQKNFCVRQCPNSKPFRKGNTCRNACDSSEFYIKEFKHGESSLQKECFSYCPDGYPFYYETSGKKECVENCNSGDYYFEKTNDKVSSKKDKLCLTECKRTSSVYKYKIESETSRRCYDECPTEKKYHKSNGDDNNCYEECPPDAPFHEKSGEDQYICKKLEDCIKNYVDFESGLCGENNLEDNEQCPDGKYKTKYKFNSGANYKFICSSECLPTYGKYSTNYHICVNDCENDDLVNSYHLIKDPYNPECICENLFYESSGTIICFQNSIGKECRDMNTYKFNLYGTKKCISDCSSIGILSPTEDICHKGSYNCEDYPNSIIDSSNKKCVCKDKYYIDSNRNKVCLNEGDVCPDGYQQKYVPSIKQCVKEGEACPSSYSFLFANKYCLSSCPAGSTGQTCTDCANYWQFKANGEVECLSTCIVYIPSEKKKCVTKCEGQYSYYYDGECYSSCNLNLSPEIRIRDAIEVINPDSLSNYKCECKEGDFWYIDIEERIKYCVSSCFLETKKFNYVVMETSECVNKCPTLYPYYFNNECFSDCDNEARMKYHLTVKNDIINLSNHECQCDYLWHYKNKEENMKECINENICILSNTTKKFFSLSEIECFEKCGDIGEYGFNYICYDSCPSKTKINTDAEKIFDCFCDLDLGYWYQYEQYNGIYYECALDECPIFHENTDDTSYVRMNLIESEKKCVKSCRKDGGSKNENFFALRSICIKSCPDLTYTNEEDDECLFYDLNDTEINSLDKYKRAANVQAKELYEKSQNLGGFLYNKFNTTLEIYAVDLENTLKDISFKSNLTYIDLNTCIKKIFEQNKDYLTKDLKILVAKYDLLPDANSNIGKEGSNSDKYLINPVEYELFSSNMNEKLDTSVCSQNELIISYPLLLNKFDNYEGDINKNELRKKFEMGKELYYMDNSIDTFNYNNYIYNTFCTGLEINGKDLLYQDRYKYLYPNGKILCESNCTINNTNFELERVNCLCSYKKEFDFNRIEKETNDILNDPSYIVPTQSSFNVEVIKCLFNFTLKQTTLNNGAFYYCSVSLLMQISMVIVSATYGIKSALSNVRHLLNRVNFNDNIIGRRIQFKGENFNKDRIMSTNRPLNHPPKKNDAKEKYNKDIDFDSNIENDGINNTILENENDLDNNNNEGGNYEINLKKGNKANNKNPLLGSKDSINMKAEYIPPEYTFKFFKANDRGVIKKIDRSKVPFGINPDTKYLLERKKGIEYPENYLNGPYFQEQNIVIITDEKNNDANKVVNYIKNEKYLKNNQKPKNDNNDDNKNNKEENKADYNIKKRNNLFGDNNNLSEKEKNLIAIKKINKNDNEYTEESLLKEFDEKDELKLKVGELGLLSSIKREQVFLRVSYEKYLSKEHSDIFCVYLAEILDKIYIAKICIFLKKIDIFPIHLSLYMFCHLILLSLLTGIFSIKFIRKIWDEDNFPDFNFYILYGLIFNIIVWIIYQIFLCLLDNRDKVKVLIITKNELIEAEKNGQESMNEINYNIFREKYNSYKSQVKCKIAVFYIIVFIVTLFLTIYLISFFALYTGTKRRVLKAYYISIVEILLIKFVYGFALCSLRLASKVSKIRCLYNIVCFLNKYVS